MTAALPSAIHTDLRTIPIGVDARMLGAGGTGVSTYARSLAAAITAISDAPYRLVARNGDDGHARKALDVLRVRARSLRQTRDSLGPALEGRDVFRRAHVHFGIRGKLYPLRSDLTPGIMHWTYPVPMRIEGWVNLYTVHDAIPFDRPDLTPINPRRHRAVLDAIVAQGDRITTVSQDAREAILAALGCDPSFVVDTGQPVDVSDTVPGPIPAALLPQGYFLMIGSVEPRKNVAAVLAAFRTSGLALPLVVAGPDGWRSDPIVSEIAATPRVIRLPYVDRATLLGLIQNARALVFPSLAEGFGLPVIEAMALGTPVLTSNRGALAEVSGGAALTVDPTDVAAIAVALGDLATQDSLCAMLAASGMIHARTFSQERFEARLRKVYQDALQKYALDGNAAGPKIRRH